MLVRRKRSTCSILVCLPVLGWLLSGCQAPQPFTGFEDEEEILEHVERTEMLHRHARLDLKGGGSFPFDSDMESAGGFGVKASIEGFKNVFFGVEYDFFHHEIDETIEDLLDDFNNQGRARADADAEQWLEEFDRHNILFLVDYYVPTGDFWGSYTPRVRLGVGLGAVIIDGEEVEGAFADEVDARVFANFLARPSLGVNVPLHENVELFAEANVDIMPDGELTIDTKLAGENRRTRIDDRINFSAVSIFGGLSIVW